MTHHLRDLLPRLKKYSAELDQASFLVDKPWVVSHDKNAPFQKLIFRRDGRVHLSNEGNLTDGKWEYLPVVFQKVCLGPLAWAGNLRVFSYCIYRFRMPDQVSGKVFGHT